MRILIGLCIVVCFTCSAFGQNEVRRPPFITKSPKPSEIFRDGNEVMLDCKAEGIPAVRYVWKKNGVELNLNLLNIERGSDGNIKIKSANKTDEGFYQCFAANQYGTALSNTAHIQRASLTDSSQTSIAMTVDEGRPFVIPASRRKSFPEPTYNWETASSTIDSNPRQLHPSQRMQVACNGDLYFAYAEKADELSGHIYKSTVFNPVLDVKSGGSYTNVTVKQGPLSNFAPNISYSSVSLDIALIGGSVTLKCFFSGKPLPDVTWTGPSNTLPTGRHRYSTYKSELTIYDIIASDEGNYVCAGTNSDGNYQHTLHFRVEAVPKFIGNSNESPGIIATEGESATFNCDTSAKPAAAVVWLQNGQPIDATKAPARFAFSEDMKNLTIRDVCRECTDRESQTDLIVIQCNASNVHGYAFASRYLNVLKKTELSLPPSTFASVDLAKKEQFQYNCSATSDPSTPVEVHWYRMGPNGRESVHNVPPYVQLTNGTLTITTDANCSAKCAEHLVEYRCTADNGYSQASAIVIFNYTKSWEDAPVDPGSWLWIIIGIAIACFLLLLFLICCIVCLYPKGDEYDVDSKERKSGRNPEKEILDCDFQDYYPIMKDTPKGSQVSIGSANVFKGVDTMGNEYDDDDGDFGEDGSFVGKYADRPL